MKDKLLILDLDECLWHSIFYTHTEDLTYDFLKESFPILDGHYQVMPRPHLQEFLDYAFKNFKVGVWTAAGRQYAEEALGKIGIDLSDLQFFYSEENCTPKYDPISGMYVYIKKISKLRKKGYDMNKVIMIDDKPEWIDSYGNVIKMKPFFGEYYDKELVKLIDYLEKIKDSDNFRKIEKRGWNYTTS